MANNNNMNGWDVASLVTITFVNDAIRTQGSSPPSMQLSTDIMDVKAVFGTWQITIGGGPDLLMFNLPLVSMAGTISENGRIITQFNYQNLAARVQLVLKFIDRGAGGHDLVVDSNSPPTSVVSLLDSNGQPLANSNSLDDAYIKEALTDWFGTNLSQFNHVFVNLALDPGVDPNAQWAFCKPAVMAHTFVSGTSLANSYLGLMYNTAGNRTPGATAQVDPSFIPPGCEAAFMLSPAMFLTNFLAPSTATQFHIPPPVLLVDTDQMSVSLPTGAQFDLPPVTGSDNNQYQPVLNGLETVVENSIITMYATSSTLVLDAWYGSVTAHCLSQSWMTLGLDAQGQGLVYTSTQPPINNHTIEQSQGFQIIQEILEIIGIVVLVVSTILTDGAVLLVVGALAGIAEGGLEWALAWFDEHHQNDAPEIDTLVSNLTLPVTWTSSGPFAVSQAGLNQGAFFLAGEMRPGASIQKDLRSRFRH